MLAHQHVAVVGTGLIGGSIALALSQHGISVQVWDTDPFALEWAREYGIRGALSIEDVVVGAGLVIIATPPASIVETGRSLLGSLEAGTTITDVGSVKGSVVSELSKEFEAQGNRFVPSHPMAGKALRGFRQAQETLFADCTWVVCDERSDKAVQLVHNMARMLGARRVVTRAPIQHDRQVAIVSHLPQLLVTAMTASLPVKANRVLHEHASLREALRLSTSELEMWGQIVEQNADAINEAIEDARVIVDLHSTRTSLEHEPRPHEGVLAMSLTLYETAMQREAKDPGTLELQGPGFRAATSAHGLGSEALKATGMPMVRQALDDIEKAMSDPQLLAEMFWMANRRAESMV